MLVDGNRAPALDLPVRCVVGGDATVPEISAASIVAKVLRDRLMARLALRYPGYGWERNAGYGTAAHLAGPGTAGPEPAPPARLCALRTPACRPGRPGRGAWLSCAQGRPSIAAQNASRAMKLSALSLGERISSRNAQPGQAGRLAGQAKMMAGADPVERRLAMRWLREKIVDQCRALVVDAQWLVELQQCRRHDGAAEPA